jgi:hypothetical protein
MVVVGTDVVDVEVTDMVDVDAVVVVGGEGETPIMAHFSDAYRPEKVWATVTYSVCPLILNSVVFGGSIEAVTDPGDISISAGLTPLEFDIPRFRSWTVNEPVGKLLPTYTLVNWLDCATAVPLASTRAEKSTNVKNMDLEQGTDSR